MAHPTGLPYTPSVAAGDWVVVSGQLGLRDGALVDDFAGEVDQVLVNLQGQLAGHGLGLEHVVKTTCFLVDLDQFGEILGLGTGGGDAERHAFADKADLVARKRMLVRSVVGGQ